MNCHERTAAALDLQQPDWVPILSCTEAHNEIYTPRLAEEMGCDTYGPDAVAAVRLCEELLAA